MQAEAEPARALPWFGAVQGVALVPSEGALGATSSAEPVAALVLTEGGQVMVHDLKTLQPLPLALPLQELPPVTACAFMRACCAPEVRLVVSHPSNAIKSSRQPSPILHSYGTCKLP